MPRVDGLYPRVAPYATWNEADSTVDHVVHGDHAWLCANGTEIPRDEGVTLWIWKWVTNSIRIDQILIIYICVDIYVL